MIACFSIHLQFKAGVFLLKWFKRKSVAPKVLYVIILYFIFIVLLRRSAVLHSLLSKPVSCSALIGVRNHMRNSCS